VMQKIVPELQIVPCVGVDRTRKVDEDQAQN
jgi:hypothetical protein